MHFFKCKLELAAIEHDTSRAATVQERAGGNKVCLNIVDPDDAVINTIEVVREITNDQVTSLCISISYTQEALWGCVILISAMRSDETCQVSVSRVYGDRVITVPGIEYCPHRARWDS